MSSFGPQNTIQEPTPLRPMPPVNLRERLHIPTTPRPISQETTYTDRTSRRGSLETNPPHLAPGEHPHIMTAMALNLGPQVPTPPPSPPLLERPGDLKKWMAWIFVGAAATAITLLILIMALLIFFGLKDHSSTVYVKASPLSPNGTETSISADPGSTLGQRGGFKSTLSRKLADANLSEHHTSTLISTFTIFGNSFAVIPAPELATREQDSMVATVQANIITTTTPNMISTEIIRITALIPTEPTVTKTITAVAVPPSGPTVPPPASVTVDLQFIVVNSGRVTSMKEEAIWNTVFAVFVMGGIIVCYRGF
ncbi:hypothetical protein DL95DRAFT_460562 [Leptodontidium sp. 2 PMI_412]|nr:hypothetical protein BKA61DRAFT_664960 [Leptodontidium sp. MPI-SDFR-AT-0119]KAH9216019.1 hypothetical protein DL95DRAFT_460562 [Leptodontidium sp. 2 PMI_412]